MHAWRRISVSNKELVTFAQVSPRINDASVGRGPGSLDLFSCRYARRNRRVYFIAFSRLSARRFVNSRLRYSSWYRYTLTCDNDNSNYSAKLSCTSYHLEQERSDLCCVRTELKVNLRVIRVSSPICFISRFDVPNLMDLSDGVYSYAEWRTLSIARDLRSSCPVSDQMLKDDFRRLYDRHIYPYL